MKEAYLPFLGYLILQLAVVIIGLNVIHEQEIGFSSILKSWIFGQMLLFATFQLLAVPMIILRWNFYTLFWSYLGIIILLFSIGCWRLKKIRIHFRINLKNYSWLSILLMIVAAALILCQSGIYFFGIHLDEDDARWLAEANDALEYGHMMTTNFYTGEFTGQFFMLKDVTSPWPLFFAILSRILCTRVSIVAHTLYPTVELLLMYTVYYLIAKELFKKSEARISFVLIASVINYFFGGTVYTQSVFSLIRIWQGKATVAAVIIPLLLYLFICINKKNKTEDWAAVTITGCAACLMSGMGISLSFIMIAVYGAYHIIVFQRWRQVPLWIVSMIPSAATIFVYLVLKG